MGGDYFRRGINKCKSKKDNGNLYKVHSTGALRERLAVTYCIQSVDFSNGTYLNILLQAQRKKKGKKITKSELDNIVGIGQILKNRLIKKFKSVKSIRNATIEDLMTVRGINEKIARCITNEYK